RDRPGGQERRGGVGWTRGLTAGVGTEQADSIGLGCVPTVVLQDRRQAGDLAGDRPRPHRVPGVADRTELRERLVDPALLWSGDSVAIGDRGRRRRAVGSVVVELVVLCRRRDAEGGGENAARDAGMHWGVLGCRALGPGRTKWFSVGT